MSEQLPLMPGCDFVELYKVLKVQGWVGSGSDAKLVISEGLVEVNGELETRKRRKLVAGDHVQFNGEQVIIAPADGNAQPKAKVGSGAPKKRARPSIEF
ncbi:RNA-binding S4 domain-containing protein [Ferrimonas sediminicola]|uniref:RNA-binding S4 domain-containing protein n=1 Tax=Ferrimonas sediminicola TaxID=2569538 RepID=A0A4U1BCZ3_9GAMM|nr:RNA-binding S4 domain-containing protein [Ferrimonas sediminicola]